MSPEVPQRFETKEQLLAAITLSSEFQERSARAREIFVGAPGRTVEGGYLTVALSDVLVGAPGIISLEQFEGLVQNEGKILLRRAGDIVSDLWNATREDTGLLGNRLRDWEFKAGRSVGYRVFGGRYTRVKVNIDLAEWTSQIEEFGVDDQPTGKVEQGSLLIAENVLRFHPHFSEFIMVYREVAAWLRQHKMGLV